MSFIKLVAAFLLINAVFVYGENEFRNYRLIRISPKSQKQIDLVGSWQHNLDFDIWNVKEAHIDVALSPKSFESYSAILNENSIEYKILNNDIQRNIDEETRSIKLKALSGDNKITGTFASYTDTIAWLDQQAALYSHVTTYSSGKTAENRDLKVIRINKPTTQRKVWIDCGIHAREWISPSTCVWIINEFISKYDSDATVKSVVDYYDIHVLPLHNPDGYAFSQSSSANRLWRKNRKVNSGSTCIGVDLNRNFGFQWMVAGASNNPCSDTYAGPTPDSELETKAVEGVINTYKGQWDAFFTIHTYGQYWFTPWGYTTALPSDYNELVAKSNIGTAAIKAVNNLTFRVGSSTNLLYAAAGGSDDWAKGVAGVKYSHCLELRPADTGVDASFGFQLPVDRAPKAGEETFRGILAFLASFVKP